MTPDNTARPVPPPHPAAVAVQLRALHAEFADLLAQPDRGYSRAPADTRHTYFHHQGVVTSLLDGADVADPALAVTIDEVFTDVAGRDDWLRATVARHPHLPQRLREALAADPHDAVRACLARGLPADHPLLARLAADASPEVAMAAMVARLPHTGWPVDILAITDVDRLDAELNNEDLSDELADAMLAHPDPHVRRRALPCTRMDLYWRRGRHGGTVANRNAIMLADDISPIARASAVGHPLLPGDVLTRLGADPDPTVRAAVAGRERSRWVADATETPAVVLERLAADPDPAVRAAVAGSSDAPGGALTTLAADADEAVRRQVCLNPAARPPVLAAVVQADPDLVVTALSHRHWDAHAVQRALDSRGRARLRDRLQALLSHRDSATRKAAGESLLDAPDRDTLATLASDPTSSVRAVAAASPDLPRELQLVLAADPTKTVRRAVARRVDAVADRRHRQRLETVLSLADEWTGTVDELVAAATALAEDLDDGSCDPTEATSAPQPPSGPDPAAVRRLLADALLGERYAVPGPETAWVLDAFADAGDPSVLELLRVRPSAVAAADPTVVAALSRFDHPLGRVAAAVAAVSDGHTDGVSPPDLAAAAAGPSGATDAAAVALLVTGDPAVAQALLGNPHATTTVRRAAWVVVADAIADATSQLDALWWRDRWRDRPDELTRASLEHMQARQHQRATDRVLLDHQLDETVAWWLRERHPDVRPLLGRPAVSAYRGPEEVLDALVATRKLPSEACTADLLGALLEDHAVDADAFSGRDERTDRDLARRNAEDLGRLAWLHAIHDRDVPAGLAAQVVATTPALLGIARELARPLLDGLSADRQQRRVAALRGVLPVLDDGTVGVLTDVITESLQAASAPTWSRIDRPSAQPLPAARPTGPLLDELADRLSRDAARLQRLAHLGSGTAAEHLRQHARRRSEPDAPATVTDAIGLLTRRGWGPAVDAALRMLADHLDEAAAELAARMSAADRVSQLEHLVELTQRLSDTVACGGDGRGAGGAVPSGPLRDVLLAFPAGHVARRTPTQGYKPWWSVIVAVLRDEVGDDPEAWLRLATAIAAADGQAAAGTVADLLAAARRADTTG